MDFTHSIHIARSVAEVFPFFADAENNPKWQNGMVACRWTSEARMKIGATYDQEARFMGRPIISSFVVTEFVPGERISIETTQSTFPIQVTRSICPAQGGCVVTAHIRGQPTGLLKLFSGMVPRSIRKDYEALKALLEAPLPMEDGTR